MDSVIATEPLSDFQFTLEERKETVTRLTPLSGLRIDTISPMLLIELANNEVATYHSWSCVCPRCLREDYAVCQYSPTGSLTMATWRKFYYVQGGHR
jgi:hypothetical protein